MKAITTFLLTALALPAFAVGTVPEPETIFYGKVINRSGPQPHQMTEGTLDWSISVDASEALVFTTELRPLADGTYSYQLGVPHSALALDLEADPDVIPLGASESTHEHIAITVDGKLATIAAAGGSTFDVAQATRASTYRLDLDVTFALPDSDGDGMADWWEDLHGLDKQSDDAIGDLDGDGLGNLAEFFAGSDPAVDNRITQLMTSTVIAAAEGTSGIHLQATDSDTPPADLAYTLTSVPAAGSLILRDVRPDPANSDRIMGTGDGLTQEDLNRGRLVFASEPGNENPAFTVSVHDGDPTHAAASGAITIQLYQPETGPLDAGTPEERVALALAPAPLAGVAPEDEQLVRQFILARDGGYLFWDLSPGPRPVSLDDPGTGTDPQAYAASYGPATNIALAGSAGADTITGGIGDDFLAGGPGDDSLGGGGGADRFLLLGPGDGSDTITDFTPTDGDALDLSRLLAGSSVLLSDYVQLTSAASDLEIGLDLDGDGSGFTDLTVTLMGASGPDLYALWSGGHLITNGLILPPRVEIAAGGEPASENGPTPASFTITLGSPALAPLQVTLLVTGSATNGVDYAPLPATVTIPAGQTVLEVPVTPYLDSVTEPAETVHVALQSGAGYVIAGNSSAELVIADLLPEITVTTLLPTAVKDSGTQGLFLIERSAIIDRSVLVRLVIGGTATNGSDYESIIAFVNLSSGQTTALVPVIPKAGASLQFGAESVRLSIEGHTSYRVGNPGSDEVIIVDAMSSLADWKTSHFPELAATDLDSFAMQDSGNTGLTHLVRYGFLLDPRNPGSPPEASHLPRARIIDGHFAIEFTRRLGTIDQLQYVVELSSDLKAWSADPSKVEDISATLNSNDIRKRLFRSAEPVTADRETYLRVRVLRQP